jgi:RHS repeat-associated protein
MKLNRSVILITALLLSAGSARAQQSHINQARGFNANQVYDAHDLDSVNVFNGNLVLGLPVGGNYRVGDSLSYSLKLFYNSNLWSYSEVGPGTVSTNYNYMTVWVTRFQNNTSGGGGCCYKGATYSFERFIPNDSQDPPRSSSGGDSFSVAFPNANANAGMGWQMTLGNLFEPRWAETSFDPQTTDAMLWVYQSPDGSEHQFYPTLHEDDPKAAEDADPVNDSITYTRDGSYLRMKRLDAATRTVEFPDGTVHTLQNLAPPPQGVVRFAPFWAVTRMADRFGNAVNVAYNVTRDAQQKVVSVQWVISDGLRTNYVNLQRFEEAPEYGPVIRSVDLAGFNGQRSVYNFNYDVRTIRRAWPNVEDSPVIDVNVTVPFLSSVEQPDASRYSMSPVDDYYDVTGTYSNTRYRGVLRKLTLPTGARVEWDYKPPVADPAGANYGYAYPTMSTGRNYLRRNYAGVRVRRLVEGGNTYTWRYDPQLEPQPSGCNFFSADAPCAHKVFKNKVTTPRGDYTWHYFSVYPFPHDSDVGRQPSDWHVAEYGLPLRKDVSQTLEDGTPVFLSSEVYNGGGTKLRETYVRYETDKLTQRDPWGAVVANDRRLAASKTRYLDDTEFGVKYAEEKYSEYDGLGHMRRRETEGNFAASDYRMEKTNYNNERGVYLIDPATNQPAASDTYAPFPESSPWVLGTYDFTLQREGNSTAVQQYNFNANGQLLRKRILRNDGGAGTPGVVPSDVLVVYGYDPADGSLKTEDFYGGDRTNNNLGNGALTGTLPAASEYRVTHTYQHKARRTSQHRGTNFFDYDVDVDAATGLVKTSRDVSKFPTDYSYDRMGRVTRIAPASGSRTDIQYGPVTGGANGGTPKAVVRHWTSDGATLLDQEEYEYDNLGRVKVEKKMMPVAAGTTPPPGGNFIARQTLYDGQGWLLSRSEWQAWTAGMTGFAHQTVYGNYDPFGRARLVTPADGSGHAVSFDYRGVREVKTTRKVANAFANGVSTESSVVSYEGFDRQGRFGSVSEDSGAPGTPLVKTTYLYDVGGRLKQAVTEGSTTPTPSGSDYVWVEDAVPAGAVLNGVNEIWSWTGASASPAPFGGASAHTSALLSGVHQHYFDGATQTLSVAAGDRLFSYVYLDPANPPTQVMLQWNDGTWDHRAYWAAAPSASGIPWGAEGTNGRRYMGALPAAGGWVRLEVAASAVGLEGRTVNGMAFTLYNGKATWDRAGRYRPSAGLSAGAAQEAEPPAAEDSSVTEESPAPEEPSASDEPPAAEEPPAADESSATEEPAAMTEEPTATEEPSAMTTEEPAPTEPQAATAGTTLRQTRVFTYDNRGFLNSEQLPEVGASGNGVITYGKYDTLGNVGSKLDGANRLRYDYDPAGRMTALRECLTDFAQCDAFGNSRPVKEFSFYGVDQSASGIYELGKLYQATRHNYLLNPYTNPPTAADVTITESYQYRATGALLSRRQLDTSTGVGFAQTFGYNGLGQLTSQSYPQCYQGYCQTAAASRSVGYAYDKGELTGVPGYAQNVTYHPNGMMSGVQRLNPSNQVAVTETFDKDPNNLQRPRRLTLSGGASWTTGDYSYDGSGNVKKIGSDWYVYDGAGRLVEGTAVNTTAAAEKRKQTYQYDPFGNITQKVDYAYAGTASQTQTAVSRPDVLTASNRLGGIPYDASGNATGGPNTAGIYQFDALNKMKAAPGKIYIYTADDERVWVLDHAAGSPAQIVNTFTLRGSGSEPLREYTQVGFNTSPSAWAWAKDYVHGAGRLLASESAAGRLNYHTDHLGTPRVLTNASGFVVSRHNYLPFGEEATNPAQDSERLKFTGHERDANYWPGHPMDYMHARHYLYAQGKFISVDPGRDFDLKRPQSWNLYSYVRNNPVNGADPTGEAVVLNSNVEQTVQAIRETVPENLRDDIQLKPMALEGTFYIDPERLAKVPATKSENFEDLRMLVNDTRLYVVGVAPQHRDTTNNRPILLGKSGPYGLTDEPGRAGRNTRVTVWDGLSSIDRVYVMAHELYGHAALWARGKPSGHGVNSPNTTLYERIQRTNREVRSYGLPDTMLNVVEW